MSAMSKNVILNYDNVFKREIVIYTCNLILHSEKIKVYMLETEKKAHKWFKRYNLFNIFLPEFLHL